MPLPGNLLSAADSDFETWSGNWTAGPNAASAAQSAAQAFTGTHSMAVTATAGGFASALSPQFAVTPRGAYIMSCYLLNANSGRTGGCGFNWFDSGHVLLSS